MPVEIDLDHPPPFPKRIPEKLKQIREHFNLTPDEIAAMVGARTGAEILAYENDEDDLLAIVLWNYSKLQERGTTMFDTRNECMEALLRNPEVRRYDVVNMFTQHVSRKAMRLQVVVLTLLLYSFAILLFAQNAPRTVCF